MFLSMWRGRGDKGVINDRKIDHRDTVDVYLWEECKYGR